MINLLKEHVEHKEPADQDISFVEHVVNTLGSAIAGHGGSCNNKLCTMLLSMKVLSCSRSLIGHFLIVLLGSIRSLSFKYPLINWVCNKSNTGTTESRSEGLKELLGNQNVTKL